MQKRWRNKICTSWKQTGKKQYYEMLTYINSKYFANHCHQFQHWEFSLFSSIALFWWKLPPIKTFCCRENWSAVMEKQVCLYRKARKKSSNFVYHVNLLFQRISSILSILFWNCLFYLLSVASGSFYLLFSVFIFFLSAFL